MSLGSGDGKSTKAPRLRRSAISPSHALSFCSSKNGPTFAMLADPVVVSPMLEYEAWVAY